MPGNYWHGHERLAWPARRLEPGAGYGHETRRHDREALYRGRDPGQEPEEDLEWGDERLRGTPREVHPPRRRRSRTGARRRRGPERRTGAKPRHAGEPGRGGEFRHGRNRGSGRGRGRSSRGGPGRPVGERPPYDREYGW
ncbi:MAG TPA: hypothetical protein VF212_03995 [Longimicrobiales bacterium]